MDDAESEKGTRSRTNNRISDEFKEIDAVLRGRRGDNGILGRVVKLEEKELNRKEEKKNNFDRWATIISVIIAATALIISISRH